MARNWSDGTREALEFLLWTTEMLMPPYLLKTNRPMGRRAEIEQARRLARLAEQKVLAAEKHAGRLVYRLTELGKRSVLGGRHPEERWSRAWDGQWRMVVFDLPGRCHTIRQQLLRWLRQNSFGYLQNSVWISPDSVSDITEALAEFRDDVESFSVLEAKCCAGSSDAALVRGAWDFPQINKRYEAHLSQAEGELRLSRRPATPAEVRSRLRHERLAWRRALAIDPLLPRVLLPADYLGQRAWQTHQAVMQRLLGELASLSA